MVSSRAPTSIATSYPTDPLEGLPLLYRDGGMTIADGKPAIPVPVGRTVGGTTVINSGTCFRAPREVLADWANREGVGWAMSSTRCMRRRRRYLRSRRSTPERWGGTASSAWRAHRPSARAAARSAGTRALACSAARVPWAARLRQACVPSPTCRGR